MTVDVLAGWVIGHNSERGRPKDNFTKVWFQLAKKFKTGRFFNDFLPNFLFLAMAAILVGGRGCHT